MAFDYKHQMECYPSTIYSPYWLIFLGILSSTIITNWVLFYGNFITAEISTRIKKLCRCYNKYNNFKSFPKAISLSCINIDQHNANMMTNICGVYKRDRIEQNQVPIYIHDGNNHYQLRYIDDFSVELNCKSGWVVDDLKHKQNHILFQTQSQCQINDLSAANYKISINYCLLDTCSDFDALYRLKMKSQIWGKITIHQLGINRQIKKSQMKFTVVDHTNCVILEGFEKLFVDNQEMALYLDINGKYTVSNPMSEHKVFLNDENQFLSIRYLQHKEVFLHYKSGYNVIYDRSGEIAHIPLDKMSVTLTGFSEVNNLSLRITETSKKYYVMQFVLSLLSLSTVYQLWWDGYYFVMYCVNYWGRSNWDKFCCYMFIVTNSCIVKQMVSIAICYMINSEKVSAKLKRDNIIQRFILRILCGYCVLFLPVVFGAFTGLLILLSMVGMMVALPGLVRCMMFVVSDVDLLSVAETCILSTHIGKMILAYFVGAAFYACVLFCVVTSDIFFSGHLVLIDSIGMEMLWKSISYRTASNDVQHLQSKLALLEQLWLWLL